MICLILIMTVVFISSTDSAEQKIKHLDTLLKEEEMNAKTKAWLLMVESGKMDQDEFRRITPKSIFIAPLLSGSAVKCKEGYRHDHLGQCVKVIKIDPKVQLELLLQRLNKLYTEKNEEKKEEDDDDDDDDDDVNDDDNKETESFKISSGPLQFSLPIFNSEEKTVASQNVTESGQHNVNFTVNTTATKVKSTPELIPIPLPYVFLNQTNQTKEIESSGVEPLNETEQLETSQVEGSGMVESGDKPFEEETTTESPVSLMLEENDYLDVKEEESITVTEMPSTTQVPLERTTEKIIADEENRTESYHNIVNVTSLSTPVIPKETVPEQKEIYLKKNSNSDKIIFPTDESLRTTLSPSVQSSRIRFPDEVPQPKNPSYQVPLEINYKYEKQQVHSSVIPQEQFWWLPKNWQVDENQQNSALVKVWSHLPLIHDITFSHGTSDNFKRPIPLEKTYQHKPQSQYEDGSFFISSNHQRSSSRSIHNFKNNRFQNVFRTQRPDFRIQLQA